MTAASPQMAHRIRLAQQQLARAQARPQGNYDHDSHQWGLVQAVHGTYASTLATNASLRSDQISLNDPPALNAFLVFPGVPGSFRVTAVSGDLATIVPSLPQDVPSGTAVADLPTLDVYPDGSQHTNNPAYLMPGLRWLASYVPTAGDVVLIRRGQGLSSSDRLVLGKVNGSPSPHALLLSTLNAAQKWTQGPNALWGGAGAPTIPLATSSQPGAQNGDWFFQTDAEALWQLQGGTWVPIVSLAAGTGLFTTTDPPASSLGGVGSWSLSTDTAHIFQKQAGGWVEFGLDSASTFTTATVAVGSSSPVNVTSLSLPAGTWAVTGQIFSTGSAIFVVNAWAGTTSASTTDAFASTSQVAGGPVGGVYAAAASFSGIVTLAATTTVYLEAASPTGQAFTVEPDGWGSTTTDVTGLVAVRIGGP